MILESIIIGVCFVVGCFILLAAWSMKSAKVFKKRILAHTRHLKAHTPQNQPIAHHWITVVEAIIENEPD